MHVRVVVVTPPPQVTEHELVAPVTHWYVTHGGMVHGWDVATQFPHSSCARLPMFMPATRSLFIGARCFMCVRGSWTRCIHRQLSMPATGLACPLLYAMQVRVVVI